MKKGDLLIVRCWYGCVPYLHYGIDMGDGSVVELAADEPTQLKSRPNFQAMSVRRVSRAEFSRGGLVYLDKASTTSFTDDQVVARAESQIGKSAYCLVTKNCEHFARWCQSGRWVSHQVEQTRESILRGLTSATILTGSTIAGRWLGQRPAMRATAKASLSLLVGEIAEGTARTILSRTKLSPVATDQSSRLIAAGTAAVVAGFLGGPLSGIQAFVTRQYHRHHQND
jgi:hypothetical protein